MTKWAKVIFKPGGLYKTEEMAYCVPRLKYNEMPLDKWIRDFKRTLPIISSVDVPFNESNQCYIIEHTIGIQTFIDAETIYDMDYLETMVNGYNNPKEGNFEADGQTFLYDYEINGDYYCIANPGDIWSNITRGYVGLHLWHKSSLNAGYRDGAWQYYEDPNEPPSTSVGIDLTIDIPVNESWLMPFCSALESEKYSSDIVNKLIKDIDENYFFLIDIIDVFLQRSIFDGGEYRRWVSFTKEELYEKIDYKSINNQKKDPYYAIGSYIKNGKSNYICLPLLLISS